MKKIAICIVFLLSTFTGKAQFEVGKYELGFQTQFSTIHHKDTYGSQTSNSSYQYASFGIMPAYYLTRGLAIEPEINLYFNSEQRPKYEFIANLAYTISPKESKIAPFFKIGYGTTNFYDADASYITNSTSIFNFGLGLKYLTVC